MLYSFIFQSARSLQFRNFLTYYGFVVVRNYLPASHFNHFMLLFCATRLASSDKYVCNNLGLIESLFKTFVEISKNLYGREFMTSNVHNLLHIVEDVERFEPLPSLSAYPFESYLGKMKNIIRAGHKPLIQIAKRLMERTIALPMQDACKQPYIEKTNRNCSIYVPQRQFMLCTQRTEDPWFFANGSIMKMIDAEQTDENGVFVHGVCLVAKNNSFENPFRSCNINIYESDITHIAHESTKLRPSEIECKFFPIPMENSDNMRTFVPILHTYRT